MLSPEYADQHPRPEPEPSHLRCHQIAEPGHQIDEGGHQSDELGQQEIHQLAEGIAEGRYPKAELGQQEIHRLADCQPDCHPTGPQCHPERRKSYSKVKIRYL